VNKIILILPPQLNFLKTAFDITIPSNLNQPLNLIVELSPHSLSVLWYSKDPLTMQAVSVYQCSAGEDMNKMLQQLLTGLQNNPVQPDQVFCCLHTQASILIPENHYNPSLNDDLLEQLCGEQEGVRTVIEPIPSMQIQHIYYMPLWWENLIRKTYPDVQFRHSSTLQLKTIHTGNYLKLIIYHENVKLILFKESQLQMIHSFPYETPDDVLYHILNSLKHAEILKDAISVSLAGMVDRDSALFEKLVQYLPHIEFQNLPEGIMRSEGISAYPEHFFAHLMQFASCVS